MKTPDLKPCPFCGSDRVDTHYGLDGWTSNFCRPYRIAFVRCSQCRARTKRCVNYEWAVRMWNRRASDETHA